jgi:hypothetical protein
MMQLHLHVHLHGKRPSDQGWQRIAVLVAIGMLILAALPWLGVTPNQPRPMQLQVTLVRPGAAPAPLIRAITPRSRFGPEHCYQIATTPALLRRLILALEPNPTMGDTGLEPVTSALSIRPMG